MAYHPFPVVAQDFDGDPATENKYGPEYYALALMKVFQREPVAPAVTGEYEYIALVMTPNEIALREWSGDTVTDLASEAVDSVKGVWYDITVAWDGAELTVSRGLNGGALTELLTAETTLENDSTDIGFGVGEKAEYRFDEVRLSSPSLSAEEPSKLTEYVYDALGRRVAVTDYVGTAAGGLSRSINPIPPLVRHKSNRAWIPVLGHARWWVSFRFNACCCPARGCIVCTP